MDSICVFLKMRLLVRFFLAKHLAQFILPNWSINSLLDLNTGGQKYER